MEPRPPRELPAALAFGAPAAGRPAPLVVRGSGGEWEALRSRAAGCTALLQESPVATVALVDGRPPLGLDPLLRAFDLVAEGSPEEVAGAWAAWEEAFARAPQACSTVASLVRLGTGSLVAESFAYSMLQAGPEHAAWLAARGPRTRPEPGPRVRLSEGAGRHEIRLVRAERHNAVDAALREELCDALDAAVAGGAAAIVLRGAGPSFCSGGDLDEFGARRDPVDAHFVRTGRSAADRLRRVGGRTVAVVHGACIGAGLELAAFCRRVIAAPDARFRLPETSFGLLPGSGGTVSVPTRIGRRRFLDLALTGREIGAEEALAWGLVDEVAPPPELEARVEAAVGTCRRREAARPDGRAAAGRRPQ